MTIDTFVCSVLRGVVVALCGLSSVASAESWSVIPSGTTLQLNAITVANYKTAFIAGAKGTVLKTTDAGLTWKTQRFAVGFSGAMLGIVSMNATIGIAVGEQGEVASGFAGQNLWYASQPYLNTLYDIKQTPWDVDTIGSDPQNLFTMHVTWFIGIGETGTMENIRLVHYQAQTPVALDTSMWRFSQQTVASSRALRGSAYDYSNAYIVGDSGTVLVSHNKGVSWIPTNVGTPAMLTAVAITAAKKIIAVGLNGNIWMSPDSGKSWNRKVVAGLSENLNGVSFIDSTTGVIVGDNALILKTTDGGATWIRDAVNTFVNLHSVHCYQGDDGANWLAVGDSGVIVQTVYGGAIATYTRSTDSILFGDVKASTRRDSIISFTNTSNGYLTVSARSTNPTFRVSPAKMVIDPGSSGDLKISYSPMDTSFMSALILLETDASLLTDTVFVSGQGVAAMVIQSDTVEVCANMPPDSVPMLHSAGNSVLTATVVYVSDTLFALSCTAGASPGAAIFGHFTLSHFRYVSDTFYVVFKTNAFMQTYDTVHVVATLCGSVEQGTVPVPSQSMLIENYPNPFSERTIIQISVDARTEGVVEIEDLLGRKVATVFKGILDGGRSGFEWVPGDIPSGIYWCSLKTRGRVGTRLLQWLR